MAALSLLLTWAGLLIAFYLPYPVSFVISALAFTLYLAIIAIQHLLTHRRERGRPSGERALRLPRVESR